LSSSAAYSANLLPLASMPNEYDVVVLGGGPAGLTAGLYAARSGFSAIIVEKGFPGGQITSSSLVENYPGFKDGVSGMDLGMAMHAQAEKAGSETTMAEVTGLKFADGGASKRHVVLTSEEELSGLAIIIATGSQYRALGVPGEKELIGRGVSYCATCDGPFYRGKKVAVAGGGDTAVTDALELTHYAEEVTLIHRRNELRAIQALQDKAFNNPKIRFLWSSVIDGIEGDPVVNNLRVRSVGDDIITELQVDGVFVAVGSVPSTDFLAGVLPLDESGCIVTNELMETTIAGVLAAGDVRHNSARQVVTAAGDGATAALSARRYISSL